MLKYLPITPFVGAFILLACSKSDPVVDNAVAPSDEVLEKSAGGLAAEANAGAAEAAEQAALPPASSGLSWSYSESDGTARFGPAGADPALSIQCRRGSAHERTLVFTRFVPPTTGARGTMSFTGNGEAASLPVTGIATSTGLSGYWQAAVPVGDMARDVAKTFGGRANVQVSVSGTPALAVPSAPEPRKAFARCLGG